jgi:hypothetical protein
MAVLELEYNYHDASIVEFSVGPRNELRLEIALDPVWNSSPSVVLRFGAIANLSEVTAYLELIPPRAAPDAYLARIERLEYTSAKPPRLALHLEGAGVLEIESAKVSELSAIKNLDGAGP